MILMQFCIENHIWWCLDDQWAETVFDTAKGCYQVLKSKTSQRRPVEAGQKSSDDKVSLSVINLKGKVFYRSSQWITLFVDQCFYSTPTEQSSPFMWINGFNSKLTVFNTVSFGQVHITVVGNGSHQLCRLRKGVMSNVWFALFTA